MRTLAILSFLFISLISFPAHADSKFITWQKTDDVKFRPWYLSVTDEHIQANPPESADGLSYMVGSSRVTDQELIELRADRTITAKTSDIKIDYEWPVTWQAKSVSDF